MTKESHKPLHLWQLRVWLPPAATVAHCFADPTPPPPPPSGRPRTQWLPPLRPSSAA